MSLNPLSLLEKAINEHGSAVILKERLALAADQFAVLEKKLADQEILSRQLQSDNESLQLDVTQKQNEIGRLTSQIHQAQQKAERRPEIQERLLLLIAANNGQTTEWLSKHGKHGIQSTEFHLGEMELAGLVLHVFRATDPNQWKMRHEGRRYLETNGLLK